VLGAAIAARVRAAVDRVTGVGAARPVVGVANPFAAAATLDRPVRMNDHRPGQAGFAGSSTLAMSIKAPNSLSVLLCSIADACSGGGPKKSNALEPESAFIAGTRLLLAMDRTP
jgi:hypothetical protein